ncbi:hypothetical protein H8S90_10625 [Olivibacter sp. SDN3]|uniref:hypothetical protein n=1 Tax=Olivibacter sp. SDN3 TaxID=2764720 RepID=UPI0016515255|nr:hypothetical protein [Olivibacter sp. SDN3]QNL51982.1 hypothetical protein H8S90_10625 [Olivibacter sp. SDN3]
MMKNEIIERVKAPTPGFFKKVRSIGLTVGAVGTALLSAPVSLPAVLVTAAGYMVAVGLVASAVSTAAREDKK